MSASQSRTNCLVIAAALLSLTACGGAPGETAATFRSGEAPGCPIVDNPQELREEFLATVFPRSGTDSPLFCELNPTSNSCEVQSTNLSGVVHFSGPVPPEQGCRNASGQALARCDQYAKHLITSALDQGDLIGLLRGVTRERDVMLRPDLPSYYQLQAPTNHFATWLESGGVDWTKLGGCTEGSDDDGYFCLAMGDAGPDRSTLRGLVELMDRHNGVHARLDGVQGTAERQANIFASTTGPLATYLAREGVFAPTAGHGVARVQSIAKYSALRVLDGSAMAGHQTALEAFVALPVYDAQPSQFPELTPELGLIAAQLGAYDWDESAQRVRVNDIPMSGDLTELFLGLQSTARTASRLGACDVSAELIELRQQLLRTNLLAASFPASKFFGPNLAAAATLGPSDLSNTLDRLDSCGMHQELVAATLWWTTVTVNVDPYHYGGVSTWWQCVEGQDYVDPHGDAHEIIACDCLESDFDPLTGAGSGTCTDYDVEVAWGDDREVWLDYGETLDADMTQDAVLATTLNKNLVRAAYNELLNQDNGTSDLTHTKPASDHVSILETSVRWQECQDELSETSGDYSTEVITTLECETAGLDQECATEDISSGTYIPYAVASRVCPKYVAEITGVTETSLNLHTCATPWSFTQAVAYYLENDYVPDSVIQAYPDQGNEVKPLVADFAAEAINLSQPVASMYRHRADFASVAGDVAAASQDTPNIWYANNTGLAVVDDNLTEGERFMAAGLDLVHTLGEIEVWGESGASVLARKSSSALATCTAKGCADNGRTHSRALFYRRMRDSIETYNRLATDQLQLQSRRLDGTLCFDDSGPTGYDRCASCIIGVDDDADGVFDRTECDATADLDGDTVIDCEFQCAHFDTAERLATEGSARMQDTAQLLWTQAQSPSVAGDQQDFVQSAARFARGTGDELILRHNAMLGGTDWLGYRAGEWYPGLRYDAEDGLIDVNDHIEAQLLAFDSAAAGDFDSDIRDYYERIRDLSNWGNDVQARTSELSGSVETYCEGGAEACETLWTPFHPPLDAVNAELAAMCHREVELWYYTDGDQSGDSGVSSSSFPVGDSDACPEPLIGPDFDALPATGAIPEAAAAMKVTLAEIQRAMANLEGYVQLIETNNDARIQVARARSDLDAAEDQADTVKDILVCSGAVIGATSASLASAACTAATAGTCTPLGTAGTVTVWSNAAKACAATQQDEEWLSKTPSRRELERAFFEYTMTLQTNAEAYTLASLANELIVLMSRYEADATAYLTLLAAAKRAAAYGNLVLDALIQDPLFDPSFQLMDDELAAMKHGFMNSARAARELRSLIQYDIGQEIREGGVFQVGTESYYLPKLGELTVYKPYGSDLDAAANLLQTNDGTESGVANPATAFNLVSYAGVLRHIHAQFSSLYEDAAPTINPVYIGADYSGMPIEGGLEPANPGEAAMLGDSPFYDPFQGQDIDVGCASGEIDLHNYCETFDDVRDGQDNPLAVPVGTCFNVTALSLGTRYDLAYADHMVRGENVSTFSCLMNFPGACVLEDEDSVCLEWEGAMAPYIALAPGAAGGFTYNDLVGDSTNFAPSDEDYYSAQTAVVRAILDRYRDEEHSHPDALDDANLNIPPGSFLWMIRMTRDGKAEGIADATFDPEADGLFFNAPTATNTVAEHLNAAVVVCTDDFSCPQATQVMSDFLLLGDAFLGSRCIERQTGRQVRTRFRMDPETEADLPALAYLDSDGLNAAVNATLAGPDIADRFNAQPIHSGAWIVVLRGHSDANGNALQHPWGLYRGGRHDGPRVRVALRYSYREGDAQAGDFDHNVSGLLQCPGPDDSMCVKNSCD